MDTIKTIKVAQNRQEFLIGVFTISQILKFTKYTTRLIVGFDDDGIPIYNPQIQRKIENSRVQKIADYLINDPDATFPTNLVLHIPIDVIDEQNLVDESIVEVSLNDKVFTEVERENGDIYISIIDGQHRIRGVEVAIERLEGKIDSLIKTIRGGSTTELNNQLDYASERLKDLKSIQLVVSFFIDKSLEFQAMIFSTINRTQKRVSQSLVYSLFGLDTGDTPQKTALEVIIALNSHANSPFYKRIKLYGGSYKRGESPPLSQATMVRSIVNLISENIRESENDRHKKRKDLLNRSVSSKRFLPFRKYYAIDKDNEISNALFYYFNSVKNIFLDKNNEPYWDINPDNGIENIFHTTVGFDSLLKIMVDILEKEKPSSINKTEIFEKYLLKSKDLNIEDTNRYSFNNRGKKFLYLDISLNIWPPEAREDDRLEELRALESDTQ